MADMEQLYREHYGFIFKYLMSLCGNRDVAQELTQETFFKAYINLPQLRREDRAAAWLCRIARNLYYAWYAEQKRLLPLEQLPEHSDAPDPAQTIQSRELTKQAMACLRKLEQPYREVLELHILGQVPLAKISRLYGKSESWARVTFHRARQKLLERMMKDGL